MIEGFVLVIMKVIFLWYVTLIDLCWYFGGKSYFQDRRVCLFHVFQILKHYKCCHLKVSLCIGDSTTNGSSGQIFIVKAILLQVDVIGRIWVTFRPHDVCCYKKRLSRKTVPLKWPILRAQWIKNNRWFRERRRGVKKEKYDDEAEERQGKVNK
jgi:hypothetical protein